MSADAIQVRRGRLFWQGRLVKTEGIPVMTHTYRALTRKGIEARMRRVHGRRHHVEAWEPIDVARSVRREPLPQSPSGVFGGKG